MKKEVVRKVLFYGVAILIATVSLALALVYTYQDKIIELFVAEANKHIKTKVDVRQISLSLFDKFPQVAVTLDEVNIHEGLPESQESLARADKLYFTFSIWDVLRGQYSVKQFYMEQGEVYVKVLPDGSVNYEIIASDTTSSDDTAFSFDLESINLREVAIHYIDQQLKQTYEVDAHQLAAALAVSPETIEIEADGQATIHTIKIGAGEYFKGKKVNLNSALSINRQARTIALQPSLVQVGEAAYEVGGGIAYGGVTELDLKLDGKNTNIQSLLSLLPQSMTEELSQYRSEGEVYFTGTVKGKASGKHVPSINIGFGAHDASFFHPDVQQRVEKIYLTGSFTNGEKQNAASSVLELKELKGVLNGRPFKGNLKYSNFDNPYIAFDVQGMLDVGYILGLAKIDNVRSGSGLADVRIAFSGNLNDFKARPGNSTLNTTGDITLHNVSLTLQQMPLPLSSLSGNFMFKRNDVAVSDFKGKLGESDFTVNGMFKNVMAWLILENQRLLVEADFKSRYLNFDQLLSEEQNTPEDARTGESYKLIVSPNIAFDLSASIDRMRFRRFRGKDIKGEVKLRNQVVSTPNISFRAIGGDFAVRGNLDARNRNHIKVSTAAKLNSMSVDSLFYVFENFHQSFVEERHLRGQLTTNIVSDVYFDSQLSPKTDLLQAEIEATIRNGQLINFPPMQKMSAFVKRTELANMHFAELHNSFWIQQGTIYIPEMDIRSNLSAAPVVSVSGTHTFDQQMDYKIKLPLFSKQRPDKDARFGTVAEDVNAGNSNLFLTLKGRESDFKIAYDDERVRHKIKTDLKQEGQELRDLLRGKKPKAKEKEIELQEGEYFDFN
ncbi:AsmA-like C-terminal region-containing protein [uncultured Pontibacter sp.]|uniref:AsmA-like C-terminal region-containing protein n=1 Tax=uncultured Pontibacter sp. TaxID=453356 RepID=UPI0026156DF5|nr:AsmA-like C-terminal region-containing protein [uncultured Pontibacter sp.]